jgi:hypothetical protein
MKRTIIFLTILFLLSGSEVVQAQCAMCRAVLESNGDTAVAEGINNGIVYLMAIPYLLIGGLFYFIYRKMKS